MSDGDFSTRASIHTDKHWVSPAIKQQKVREKVKKVLQACRKCIQFNAKNKTFEVKRLSLKEPFDVSFS